MQHHKPAAADAQFQFDPYSGMQLGTWLGSSEAKDELSLESIQVMNIVSEAKGGLAHTHA